MSSRPACAYCGRFMRVSGTGRPRTTCSPRCRTRLHRARSQRAAVMPHIGAPAAPTALPTGPRALAATSPLFAQERWTRRVGKRPVRIDGRPASSTRPVTWASLDAVLDPAAAGEGVGVMLGGGLACLDLDHSVDPATREVAPWAMGAIRAHAPHALAVEVSLSGEGLHVWHEAIPEMGRVLTLPGGHRAEIYSQERFIVVTGHLVALTPDPATVDRSTGPRWHALPLTTD